MTRHRIAVALTAASLVMAGTAWGDVPASPPAVVAQAAGRTLAQAAEREQEPETPAPPAAPAVPAQPGAATLPEAPTEEQQLAGLVADLQRYGALSESDLRKEIGAVTQSLGRQRNDANRIRLAILYTMSRNPQDDQRALQLLDGVAKGNGSATMKQIAGVLHVQIAERVRAVRDEQAKANDAIQKLEALRAMERSLLRDRVRGGGGAAGAGSGGG